MSGNSGNKRQRVEEEKQSEVDVELRELMGGRKYIKEEELTRAVLLEWAKRQGAVKEVSDSDLHNSSEYGGHRDRGEIGRH
jgi:hypothetical protein